ncbi:unnamed protein product [Closterium sp. NIES-53]
MTTLRVLLHVAAQRDYELHSLEFSTAFLQGSLHEEIWLRRPPGFTGMTIAALGFAPFSADPPIFLRTGTTLPPFYVLVYLNNLVFAIADTEALALVRAELQKRHTYTDLGELHNYLGLQITRDRARRTITRTQSHMVHQVLRRFGFQYSSLQPTPLSTSHSLSAPPSDESVEPSGPYPELVGCLMYLMTCTRPNHAFPLSLLARYVALGRHRKVHFDSAKRVLHYLRSTLGMGLVLGGRGSVVLTGHSDASWVDDQAIQRLSQGYTFSLGSGSVSWRSIRSFCVLGSSYEAEIYVGAMAAQELRWLTYLLTDLGERPRSPLVLYVDNKAMLALCREQRLEHRMKHIALRYFLTRELQQRGQLRLSYVASRANTDDVFTKALVSGGRRRRGGLGGRCKGCVGDRRSHEKHPPPPNTLSPTPPTAAGAAVRGEEVWQQQQLLLRHIRHPLTPSPRSSGRSRERGGGVAAAGAAEKHPPPPHTLSLTPPTAAGAAVREEEAWRQLLLLRHIHHPLTPSPPTVGGAAVREEEARWQLLLLLKHIRHPLTPSPPLLPPNCCTRSREMEEKGGGGGAGGYELRVRLQGARECRNRRAQ